MQSAHQGHHHHPPGLTKLLALLVGVLVAPSTALAATLHSLPLPSPIAPLSVAPPLAGGATTSAEARRHRVAAATTVRVSVDDSGVPFRVRATQRLTVKVPGDYFYSIGAPLTDVREAPGSERAPGLRAAAILWQGFDPGTRVLAATAELEPGAAAAALPLRLHTSNGKVILENATALTVAAYSAAAERSDVDIFIAGLRASLAGGPPPLATTVRVTSPVRQVRVRVASALGVTGTIGARRVELVLGGPGRPLRASFPAGRVRLVVRPLPPTSLLGSTSGLSGRQLLRRAVLASLDYARWTQFEQYLGNPDPSGTNETIYRYASAARTAAATGGEHTFRSKSSHPWLLALAAALAIMLAVLAWSRA